MLCLCMMGFGVFFSREVKERVILGYSFVFSAFYLDLLGCPSLELVFPSIENHPESVSTTLQASGVLTCQVPSLRALPPLHSGNAGFCSPLGLRLAGGEADIFSFLEKAV